MPRGAKPSPLPNAAPLESSHVGRIQGVCQVNPCNLVPVSDVEGLAILRLPGVAKAAIAAVGVPRCEALHVAES